MTNRLSAGADIPATANDVLELLRVRVVDYQPDLVPWANNKVAGPEIGVFAMKGGARALLSKMPIGSIDSGECTELGQLLSWMK
jgi:hypothetical protein